MSATKALQKVKPAWPEAIIDELIDLPDNPVRIEEFGASNNHISGERTSNILVAAKKARANSAVCCLNVAL